jgi:hypothetical protein
MIEHADLVSSNCCRELYGGIIFSGQTDSFGTHNYSVILPQPIHANNYIESASRPPSGFWCLNDKTIKELMAFAKCET